MTNIILGWKNQLDLPNTIVTASSEVNTLPAENIKNEHVMKPWRSAAEAPQSLTVDLAEARGVDPDPIRRDDPRWASAREAYS